VLIELVAALPHVSVLIIDDDPETRDLMEAIVTKAGYSVETARDGEEGLAMLRAIRPELILLDINMPRVDGAEFREAQRKDRSWVRIPTVVMTAGTVDPMLDLAVTYAVKKPLRKRELLRIVERHCGARGPGAIPI
jgi:two-component system, chemotaxis family, chemotaxis protein CheY